jgi:peptide/nickel transport system permease protein
MVNADKNIKNEATESTESNTPSFAKIAWNEIYQAHIAVAGLIIFGIIVVAVIIGAIMIDENALQIVHITNRNSPPSSDFILGTDPSGRSVMELLFVGAKNSLLIALFVTLLGVSVGTFVGFIAGYYGGWLDNVIMRVVDFFTILPTLMIIIVLVTLKYDYTVFDFVMIMSLFAWPWHVRLIRSKVLQQSNLDYVSASKTLGTKDLIIIFREIFPNVSSIIVVNMTLALAGNIGLETGLTFLGFGLKFNTPSLGSMIFHATNLINLSTRPWIWLPASLLILILMLCINFVGQAINRASDAKQRRV